MKSPTKLLDPVAAYDCIAGHYPDLAARRHNYLTAIENILISQIPVGASSLLDIGAGDGKRSLRIAQLSEIKEVVLLEPSAALRTRIQRPAEIWPIRAEEIGDHAMNKDRHFDVITCLWNVLGHIPTFRTRCEVLRRMTKLLSPRGRLFVDVIHRYNTRSYGIATTGVRYLRDFALPKETNTDVVVTWQMENTSCSTYGHVFTDGEMRALAKSAGLELENRVVIDYETGKIRQFGFQGNLLYKFHRNSASDSASAVTTSSTSAAVI